MSNSPIDPGDLLANRQAIDEAQHERFVDATNEASRNQNASGVWVTADPANRNLAMQLAIQKYPNASLDELKTHADEFYSYLTQQN